MKFYHYYPKEHEESVKEHGIISPYYALHKLKNTQLTEEMLAKYKDRFEKTPDTKSIINSIRKFRKDKHGDKYIYALKHPIPLGKHPALDRFVKTRNMVELEAEPSEDKDYYSKITPQEYWNVTIGQDKMLFKDIKHPGLLFKDGRYLIKKAEQGVITKLGGLLLSSTPLQAKELHTFCSKYKDCASSHKIYTVKDGAKFVGGIAINENPNITPYKSLNLHPKVAVSWFYIDPKYRTHGNGTNLFNTVISKYKNKDVVLTTGTKSNLASKKIYNNFGFKVIGSKGDTNYLYKGKE